MEVSNKRFDEFIDGANKTFIIPVYQRDYAWTVTNCQKLWDDLLSLTEDGAPPEHFLGTITIVGAGFDKYSVIDGQQRLTTMFLLLLALYKYVCKKEGEESLFAEQLYETYLIKKFAPTTESRLRLKPNKSDKKYFDRLFDNETNIDESVVSNIPNNYKFFFDKLNTGIFDSAAIFEAFKKLKVIVISLTDSDKPQLIFESLNSTGVSLTQADLIRNYLLMDNLPDVQERWYENFWQPIESNVGDVAEFVRHYLSYKTNELIRVKDVYTRFKILMFKESSTREIIFKDLLKVSKIYAHFIGVTEFHDRKIQARLNSIREFELSVAYPYFIDLFLLLEDSTIDLDTVYKALTIVESYAVRLFFIQHTTQGLNKFFPLLAKKIRNQSEWKNNYCDILTALIMKRSSPDRFPSDDLFSKAFAEENLYKATKCKVILQALENHNTDIAFDIFKFYQIEHIMPQSLSDNWKEKLGVDWHRIHESNLHKIGNLSLALAKTNEEMSNLSKEEKDVINFRLTKLHLNQGVEGTPWGEEQIKIRGQKLAQLACAVWPLKPSSFQIINKDTANCIMYSLDEITPDDFTGSKPVSISVSGNSKSVTNWNNLWVTALEYLCLESPQQFKILFHDKTLSKYFDRAQIRKPSEQIFEGHPVEMNLSASAILDMLQRICSTLNYDASNIEFEVKKNDSLYPV